MKSKEPGTIRQLFAFVGESNGKMRLSIFLAVLGELFGMGPFLMVAVLADALYQGTATPTLVLFLCGGAAVCQIIKMLLTWRSSLMSHKTSFTILKNIREAITERMAKVPMGIMLETPTGAFKNLIVDNVAKLEDSMAHFMPELPSNIAAPLCSILLIFLLDWRMGLAALVTIPLGTLFFAAMMRGYGPRMENYMRSANEMNSTLVEYVNGIQVIKAFNRSAASYGKYADSVRYFHDSTMAWWSQCWLWNAAARAVLPSTLLGTLPVGAWLYMEGSLSLPVFLVALVVPLGFIAPLMKVSKAMEQVSMIKGNLEQVTTFLKTPELVRPTEPAELGDRCYQFEDVHFAYNESEVLRGISFQTQPGTMTAIVGTSGSGKSTIAKLMAGFWDVTSGTVRFGGQDIRNIPFGQLMDEISYRYNHPDIKAALEEEITGKCAYCESKIKHIEFGDIEHILPKKKTARPDLYVEWSNLTLACEVCNRTYKKDYYDPQNPLVNPYVDDPNDFFLFLGTIISTKNNNSRGFATENILGLNRSDLVVRRNERLQSISKLLFSWEQATSPTIKDILANELKKECAPDKEYSAFVKHFRIAKGFPESKLA